MKSISKFSIAVVTLFFLSISTQAAPVSLKGGVCYSKNLRPSDGQLISCPDIGKFQSVSEIYAAGYRVVSSGVFQEAGTSTIFLIIEERK